MLVSIGLFWLLCILFFINVAAVALIRSDERFWLAHAILWIIMTGMLVFSNTMNAENVVQKEMQYQQQTDVDSPENLRATLELENAKMLKRAENNLMIRLIGFQSLLGCIFLFMGFRQTGKRQFRSGAITFSLMFLIYLLIELIWFLNTPLADSNSL